MKILFLTVLLANLFAFDFYGLKSGMSRNEVIVDYFGIKQSYIDEQIQYYEQKKKDYSYSYPLKAEAYANSALDYFSFTSTSEGVNEQISQIKSNHVLKTLPFLEKINLSYTPEGEALISLSASFTLNSPYNVNSISVAAFKEILKNQFPDAEINHIGEGEYSQFLAIFIDEGLMSEWIDKYIDKLNEFNE